MFRVVTPPIIRSRYNCNYSIWHWSNFGKCSVWSQLKMRVMDPTVSATFRDRIFRSLTSASCCIYSYLCSWCWVELSPETCRAVLQKYNKLYIVASCWTIIDTDLRCTDPWTLNSWSPYLRKATVGSQPDFFQFLVIADDSTIILIILSPVRAGLPHRFFACRFQIKLF
jgi:hypothetical protein